jgi:hypothetical protein
VTLKSRPAALHARNESFLWGECVTACCAGLRGVGLSGAKRACARRRELIRNIGHHFHFSWQTKMLRYTICGKSSKTETIRWQSVLKACSSSGAKIRGRLDGFCGTDSDASAEASRTS